MHVILNMTQPTCLRLAEGLDDTVASAVLRQFIVCRNVFSRVIIVFSGGTPPCPGLRMRQLTGRQGCVFRVNLRNSFRNTCQVRSANPVLQRNFAKVVRCTAYRTESDVEAAETKQTAPPARSPLPARPARLQLGRSRPGGRLISRTEVPSQPESLRQQPSVPSGSTESSQVVSPRPQGLLRARGGSSGAQDRRGLIKPSQHQRLAQQDDKALPGQRAAQLQTVPPARFTQGVGRMSPKQWQVRATQLHNLRHPCCLSMKVIKQRTVLHGTNVLHC